MTNPSRHRSPFLPTLTVIPPQQHSCRPLSHLRSITELLTHVAIKRRGSQRPPKVGGCGSERVKDGHNNRGAFSRRRIQLSLGGVDTNSPDECALCADPMDLLRNFPRLLLIVPQMNGWMAESVYSNRAYFTPRRIYAHGAVYQVVCCIVDSGRIWIMTYNSCSTETVRSLTIFHFMKLLSRPNSCCVLNTPFTTKLDRTLYPWFYGSLRIEGLNPTH